MATRIESAVVIKGLTSDTLSLIVSGSTFLTKNVTIGITGGTEQSILKLRGGTSLFDVDNKVLFRSQNATGGTDTYLWPRWTDDIMYLNFGYGGLSVRNNTSQQSMFLTNNLNVGINQSPTTKLDILATASLDGLKLGDGTNWLQLFGGTLGTSAYNPIAIAGDNGTIFSKGGVETGTYILAPHSTTLGGLRITPSGRVGFATIAPTSQVYVTSRSGDTIVGQGFTSDSTTYGLKLRNATPADYFTARNDGKISIGALQDFTAKVNIDGAALATAPGSQVFLERLITTDANTDILDISNTRTSNGGDWQTAGYRIQAKVDTTWMGYLQFNGDNNGGVALGTGNSTAGATGITNSLTIDINGSVKINKTPTTATSGSTTDQMLVRSTDGTIKVADTGVLQMYSARVFISSGSVLTMNSTPIQIVPAPPSTHYIKVMAATAKLVYNGSPYTNNPQVSLINTGAGSPQFVTPTLFLQGTTAQTKSFGVFATNNITETMLPPGRSLTVSSLVGNPSAGNSPIIVVVHYLIVPDF